MSQPTSRKKRFLTIFITLALVAVFLYLLSPLERYAKYRIEKGLSSITRLVGGELISCYIDDVSIGFHQTVISGMRYEVTRSDSLFDVKIGEISVAYEPWDLLFANSFETLSVPKIEVARRLYSTKSENEFQEVAVRKWLAEELPIDALQNYLSVAVRHLKHLQIDLVTFPYAEEKLREVFELKDSIQMVKNEDNSLIYHLDITRESPVGGIRKVDHVMGGFTFLGKSFQIKTTPWYPNPIEDPELYQTIYLVDIEGEKSDLPATNSPHDEFILQSDGLVVRSTFLEKWWGKKGTRSGFQLNRAGFRGLALCIDCSEPIVGLVRPWLTIGVVHEEVRVELANDRVAPSQPYDIKEKLKAASHWFLFSKFHGTSTIYPATFAFINSVTDSNAKRVDEKGLLTAHLNKFFIKLQKKGPLLFNVDLKLIDGDQHYLDLTFERSDDSSLTINMLGKDFSLTDLYWVFKNNRYLRGLDLSGHLSGSLIVRYEPGRLTARFGDDFALHRFGLLIPALASEPTEFPELSLGGAFTISLKPSCSLFDISFSCLKAVAIEKGLFNLGTSGNITFRGWWRDNGVVKEDSLSGDIDVMLEGDHINAHRVMIALPWNMAEVVDGADFVGDVTFAFHLKGALDKPDDINIMGHIFGDVRVVRDGFTSQLAPFDSDLTVEDSLRDAVQRLYEGEGGRADVDWDWAPFWTLRQRVINTVIAAEDATFWKHYGFSWAGIQRALIENVRHGRLQRGGSTISQQVVKNVFLADERTVARKLQELYLTWRLEKELSKQRILEIYLNVARWGEHFRGIQRAAKHYFGRDANDLEIPELALLAAILPNPVLYGKQLDQGYIDAGRVEKIEHILSNMRWLKQITPGEYTHWMGRAHKGKIGLNSYVVIPEGSAVPTKAPKK